MKRAPLALLPILLLAAGCADRLAAGERAEATPGAAPAPAEAPPTRSVVVERAVDGDTLALAGGERVRIQGIDAPEVHDVSPILRELAEQAHQELSRRVAGRTVRLVVADPPLDHFGRTLAYVELEDGGVTMDVGAALLEAGFARTYPTTHARLGRYIAIEQVARQAGHGVWTAAARKAWSPQAEIAIGPAAARANVGRVARVEGKLARTTRTERALFLFVEAGGASMRAVAFRLALFPPEQVRAWEGHDVAVTGLVKLYEDEPEVVLDRPDQVELIAAEPADVTP